jgi:sorbose reductase
VLLQVANAGVPQMDNTIMHVDPKVLENIIHINYTSVVYQAALCGEYWSKHAPQGPNTGRFIITSSGAASSNIRPLDQGVYNSSKAAVKVLARSLAQEFKDFARVNSVSRKPRHEGWEGMLKPLN